MDIEGVVLDREVRRLRDMLAVRFSEIIYNGPFVPPPRLCARARARATWAVSDKVLWAVALGPGFWFSPEQEFIMAGVKQSQQGVDGSVELKLTRGNVYVVAYQARGPVCGPCR
jgi:argininosuccinate synthase